MRALWQKTDKTGSDGHDRVAGVHINAKALSILIDHIVRWLDLKSATSFFEFFFFSD